MRWLTSEAKVALRKITCAYCGARARKEIGSINRSKKRDAPIYCGRKCSGIARRSNKTRDQLVSEKKMYDADYRLKNSAALKEKKATWFQRTYDPEKAAVNRKKTMQRHIEYCRRPEYVAWKKQYDRKYLAKKNYGEFWEAKIALLNIDEELKPHRYEIMIQNDTFCKAQRRKRECQIQQNLLLRT